MKTPQRVLAQIFRPLIQPSSTGTASRAPCAGWAWARRGLALARSPQEADRPPWHSARRALEKDRPPHFCFVRASRPRQAHRGGGSGPGVQVVALDSLGPPAGDVAQRDPRRCPIYRAAWTCSKSASARIKDILAEGPRRGQPLTRYPGWSRAGALVPSQLTLGPAAGPALQPQLAWP